MQEREKIIERIQKILARSHSSNEHEAATALAKAQALLAEHNLSLAEVQVRTGKKSTYVQYQHMLAGQDQWRRELMATIARFNFCELVFWSGTVRVALIGEQENIEAVLVMTRFVEEQLEQFAASGFARYARSGGSAHGRSWKVSFYQGALAVIQRRLQEERRALEARPLPSSASSASSGRFLSGVDSAPVPTCRALLVVKERDLKEALQQFYPKVRKGASRRHITALDGYQAGRQAGERVRFRQEVDQPRSLWP